MDQLHNMQQSVQIESIGAACLGIVLLKQQQQCTSLFFSVLFTVILALLSPSQ